MLYFIYFCIFSVLYFLIFKILCFLFNIEDKKVLRKYQNTKVIKTRKINPKHIFKKMIIIPAYKKDEMERNFKSLNVEKTAEEYYSECIYSAFVPLSVSILFAGLRMYHFSIILLVLSGYLFFREQGRLQRALQHRKICIEEEAPGMIRFFIAELKNKENIKSIFEKYQEIAKYLLPDIKKTVLDMNTTISNQDVMLEALHNLDERLNTQITRDFITGLIDSLSGKDQINYFSLIERDLKVISIKNLDRRSRKVDASVRNSMFIIIFAYIFLMASMIGIYLKTFINL